eukprot:13726776-Ditylum_brightwellii.AAC.1
MHIATSEQPTFYMNVHYRSQPLFENTTKQVLLTASGGAVSLSYTTELATLLVKDNGLGFLSSCQHAILAFIVLIIRAIKATKQCPTLCQGNIILH